jgi:hypothetical protein
VGWNLELGHGGGVFLQPNGREETGMGPEAHRDESGIVLSIFHWCPPKVPSSLHPKGCQVEGLILCRTEGRRRCLVGQRSMRNCPVGQRWKGRLIIVDCRMCWCEWTAGCGEVSAVIDASDDVSDDFGKKPT